MQIVALPWSAVELGAGPGEVAIIVGLQYFPALVVAPFGGSPSARPSWPIWCQRRAEIAGIRMALVGAAAGLVAVTRAASILGGRRDSAVNVELQSR